MTSSKFRKENASSFRPAEPDFSSGNRIRAAIVGVGDVGSSTAFAFVQSGVARELILADVNVAKAEGEAMDLGHCIPFSAPIEIHIASPDEVENCDLVVITAGAAQKPGETRMDLVGRNVAIFEQLVPVLARNNPRCIFMIVTNPVDVMTMVALELSGFPAERVIGTGTVLDTARFRRYLGRAMRIATSNIHAYVVGEHGDSEVLVWSRAMVGPFHVDDYARLRGIPLGKKERDAIDRDVRHAAYEIIERKGSTHFAIAMGCNRLAESIFGDQDHLFTVARQLEGTCGLEGVALSVPTLLNRKGAAIPLEMPLDESERAALQRSAEAIRSVWDQL